MNTRQNPDSEENQRMTRENEAAVKTAQWGHERSLNRKTVLIVWIPVGEEMPDCDETVLLCDDEDDIFSGWTDGATWFQGVEQEAPNVTHWARPKGPR